MLSQLFFTEGGGRLRDKSVGQRPPNFGRSIPDPTPRPRSAVSMPLPGDCPPWEFVDADKDGEASITEVIGEHTSELLYGGDKFVCATSCYFFLMLSSLLVRCL